LAASSTTLRIAVVFVALGTAVIDFPGLITGSLLAVDGVDVDLDN
jgi:hypothetical protein